MFKNITFPLSFSNTIQLIHIGIKAGIFQLDPNDKNSIIVYMAANKDYPEGWYSQNILTAASDLSQNIIAQKYILKEYEKRGIFVDFTNF